MGSEMCIRDSSNDAEEETNAAYFMTTSQAATRARYGLVFEEFKYVFNDRLPEDDAPPPEALYRLPDESRNIAQSQQDLLARLRAIVEQRRGSMNPLPRPNRSVTVEETEALRALGYLGD